MASAIPKPRYSSFSLVLSKSGSSTTETSSSCASANKSSSSERVNVNRASIASAPSSPHSISSVPLGSRVVLGRRRAGYVRFIGRLENEAGNWYGIALDEAKGDNDGSWGGARLFDCLPRHGVFVRRKEIVCAKEQSMLVKGDGGSSRSPRSFVQLDTSDNASLSSEDSTERERALRGSPVVVAPLDLPSEPPLSNAVESPLHSDNVGSGSPLATASPYVSPSKLRAPTIRPSIRPNSGIAMSPLSPADTRVAIETKVVQSSQQQQPLQISTTKPSSPISRRSSGSPPSSSSPTRRLSERRGLGTSLGPSMTATTAVARIAELEKEIMAMKTTHENVISVLRATNKQHAANVLELRDEVAQLTDVNAWLQQQLDAKSTALDESRRLHEHAQRECMAVTAQLVAKDAALHALTQKKDATAQAAADLEGTHLSQLEVLQVEFNNKLRREEQRVQQLRAEVVAICNERTALQCDLQEIKTMTFLC